jgi:hypothetical protein
MGQERDVPDDIDDDLEDQDSPVIKDLRGKAKRTDAAEARANELETEIAILRAGGQNLTPLQQKALLASHEGERTPEALAATAKELGFPLAGAAGSTEAEAPQGATADEQKALGAMQEATAAAEASEAQVQTLDDKIAQAKTPEELDAILANAGMLGISQ